MSDGNLMTPSKLVVRLFLAVILATMSARPQTKDASELNNALRRMETVGKTFRSFQAQFSQKKFIAVLNEFDAAVDTGEFYYSLAPDGSALIREEFRKPSRILTIKGGTGTLYEKSLNEAKILNLGKNKDKAEYLALGIGQSPAKLQQNFDIQYQGTENINGAPCWMLLFKPKASAAMFSAITLWVKKSSGVPVQDKLLESATGDYTLITFSNEQLNKAIPASQFEQKLPPGVQKIVIQ
jgi:outer membrane lipoprotein-sorting protein